MLGQRLNNNFSYIFSMQKVNHSDNQIVAELCVGGGNKGIN